MEKIYCGIEERKVIRGKCLHDKKQTQRNNPTCPRCHYYLQLYPPQKLEIEAEKRRRPLFPVIDNSKLLRHFKKLTQQYDLRTVFSIVDNEDPLKRILNDIPLVLELHNSFWEDPHFRAWQCLRLNKQYRVQCLNKWKPFIKWGKEQLSPDNTLSIGKLLDLKKIEENRTKEIDYVLVGSLCLLSCFLMEIYPNHGEKFNDWKDRLSEVERLRWNAMITTNMSLYMCRSEMDRISGEQIFDKYLEAINFMPLRYEIRFPLPSLLKERVMPDPPSVRGNPQFKQNLARNLLVFELSEFLRDKDIKFLLGIHGTRSELDDKDSSFSHLSRIRKTVRKSIEGAPTVLAT